MEKYIALLFQFLVLPVLEIAVFFLPLIFLSLVIRLLKERIDRLLINDFGRPPYYLFAALGTPIHEFSHLVMCLFFRHRVKRFSLFHPDRNGRLGYVEHAYDPGSPYQRAGCFFIGLAPLFGGAAALYVLTRLFLPNTAFYDEVPFTVFKLKQESLNLIFPFFKEITRLFLVFSKDFIQWILGFSWKVILYLFLVTGIGSHMFPSMSDIHGALPGFLIIYAVVCFANILIILLGSDLNVLIQKMGPISGFLINLMIFTILILSVCIGLLYLIRTLKTLIFH
jgi:hypothetical protein